MAVASSGAGGRRGPGASDPGREQGDRGSAVAQWYVGRGVFVTGGSGFLGKALVEKLLRSCPTVGAVYLLLRPKKGCTSSQRLEELTRNSIFDRLRLERGDTWDGKLRAVDGDVSQLGLGLSDQDQRLLREGSGPLPAVSVVFHCAASVRFDLSLQTSLLLNTRGAREVVRLGRSLPALEALVHVSTTFCQLDREHMEEVVYPSSVDPHEMIEHAEQECGGELLDAMAPELLKGYENTYVFTKFLAEQIINETRTTLPTSIFRPSIVCPAVEEPFPGWVQSANGPMGLIMGAGAGVIRSVYGDGDLLTDLLPVDIAIAAMIVIAWKTGTSHGHLPWSTDEAKRMRENQPLPVYNGATGSEAPISWNQFLDYGRLAYDKYPSPDIMWYPGGKIWKNRVPYYIFYFLFQLLPALLVDTVLLILRKKPWFMKLQLRILQAIRAMEPFIGREWSFDNSKLRELRESLSAVDAAVFRFSAEGIDYRKYVEDWVLGMRRYMQKVGDETLPEHRRKMRRLFWADKALKVAFWISVAWLVTWTFGAIGGVEKVIGRLPCSCPRHVMHT